ncbi:MAG: hypothetical protein WBD25_15980 [Terriglobales bacterium]|jgi:hypothetical protein
MKILLVHPHDSVEVGTWAETLWDLVVDLGWSGRQVYLRQSELLGFRVFSIYDFLDHEQHRDRMREILALGLDQLVDAESVDWWEAFSVYPYHQLEQLLLLSALAEQIPADAEIFTTSPHFALRALSLLLNREIKSFSVEHKSAFQERSRRYWKAAFALRPAQTIEIIFDKWDTDYRLRRHFARPPKQSPAPAVLLPSAYANVSRAQVAYARMLPHRRFLLVVTRCNGHIQNLPGNVEVRSLASYAPRLLSATEKECTRLLARWQDLHNNVFETNPVLRLARKLHVFDEFANFLQSGLRIRDAWREVFAREPITTVLSGDEYNPYTRLPVVLAASMKLRTVFCDHGALNMSFGIRRPCSEAYLVKGNMARDYSIGWCGLSPDKIVVGGPREAQPLLVSNQAQRDWIVFYSEAYELSSGRTQAFYAELLPELCRLASLTNRKVIVKLHPFESLSTRKLFVDKALSPEQRSLVTLREGSMTQDLFARAWCSLTVESSVAVESTINGVPCFLCGWFDASWYDYGKQYAKFSAGYTLDSPQRIREIPKLIEQFRITEATRQNLQTEISPEHLESVLSGI